MSLSGKKEAVLLFLGDILFFILALWLALSLRYWTVPDWGSFRFHVAVFLHIVEFCNRPNH